MAIFDVVDEVFGLVKHVYKWRIGMGNRRPCLRIHVYLMMYQGC